MTALETRTNATDLQIGDRLSRVSYVEVVDKSPRNLKIRNQEGLEWTISNNIAENEMYSASQFSEERVVSRTEMVEALENAGDTIFTVVFDKKISQKDISNYIRGLQQDTDSFSEMSKRNIDALAKNLLVGEERTLVGYLASTEPKMGRSTVVDLEVPGTQYNLRLVDHRTIKSLTIKNVNYVLKS